MSASELRIVECVWGRGTLGDGDRVFLLYVFHIIGFYLTSSPVFSSWRAIIDHLMTHDKTTFRDLMSKYN